mgnify:CR=1 FL=1
MVTIKPEKIKHLQIEPWHGVPTPPLTGSLLQSLCDMIGAKPSQVVIKRRIKGQLIKLSYAINQLRCIRAGFTSTRLKSDRAKYEAMRDKAIVEIVELRVILTQVREISFFSINARNVRPYVYTRSEWI